MKKYLLYLLSVLSIQAIGQQDSSDVKKLLSLQRSRPIVGLEYEIGGANNSIRFSSLLQFSSSGFLNDQDKQSILDDASSQVGLGFWQSYRLSWDRPGLDVLGAYSPGKKFSIRNEFMLGLSSPNQLIELGLFGNKRFEGTTFDLTDAAYETWWYTAFDYEYDFKHDSMHYLIGGSVYLGHDYESYHVDQGEFFTAEDGEYIDADLEYDLRRIDSENEIPLNGIGVGAIFEWQRSIGKSYRFKVGVRDLGFMYWGNLEDTEVDSSFRFRGVQFDNIFDLTDSIRDAEAERFENGFYSVSDQNQFRLLPFSVNLQVKRVIKHRMLKAAYLHSDYRYLYGYNARFGAGVEWQFGEAHKLSSEINYGGFNSTALRLHYRITLKERLVISLSTNNVLAAVFPNSSTGSSAYVGLFYEL
jgi:hypothetical protein